MRRTIELANFKKLTFVVLFFISFLPAESILLNFAPVNYVVADFPFTVKSINFCDKCIPVCTWHCSESIFTAATWAMVNKK